MKHLPEYSTNNFEKNIEEEGELKINNKTKKVSACDKKQPILQLVLGIERKS